MWPCSGAVRQEERRRPRTLEFDIARVRRSGLQLSAASAGARVAAGVSPSFMLLDEPFAGAPVAVADIQAIML